MVFDDLGETGCVGRRQQTDSRQVVSCGGVGGQVIELTDAGHDAALGQRRLVHVGMLLERGNQNVSAHRLAVQDCPTRRTVSSNEEVAQCERIVDAPIRAVAVAAVARRCPGVAIGDQVLANGRIADEDLRTFAAIAVRKEHQTAVPHGRDLDAVRTASVVTRLGARAT